MMAHWAPPSKQGFHSDMKYLIPFLLLFPLSAAALVIEPEQAKSEREVNLPSSFHVCSEHGCRRKQIIGFDYKQWKRIVKAMKPAAPNPEVERVQLMQVIGIIETIVGRKTGTSKDKPMTEYATNRKGQMDCLDEALNTGRYVQMLIDQGLVKYHTLDGRLRRGFFVNGWPHTAPVLVDKSTDKRYVIDSWFLENGKPAFIVPVDEWQDSWHPPVAPAAMGNPQ